MPLYGDPSVRIWHVRQLDCWNQEAEKLGEDQIENPEG
jgi:hypothetical protein